MRPKLLISNRILVTFLGIFFLFYTSINAAPINAVSNRDVDNKVIFQLAFENLGLYMAAVEHELRLTPLEKRAFGEIAKAANIRKNNLVFREPHFNLEFSNNQKEFSLDGTAVRTAVTTRDPLSAVKVNLKIINSPSSQFDLLEAIQLMIHEFAHKTSHSGEGYVDRMAQKVTAALKNHYHTFHIEPGYKITILGLTSPFILLYNDLRRRGVEDSQLLTEIYRFHQMYSGNEVTMLEYRGSQIRYQGQISGYLRNPVGFSNVPQGSQIALIPMSMTDVQDVRKEQLGERFPRIILSTVTHQEIVEYVAGVMRTPKVASSSFTRQFAANQVKSEIVIYTDRTGIKSISRRAFRRQYFAESYIDKLTYKDGNIDGEGILKVHPDDFGSMKKKGIQIDIMIKFKDGQTLVPAKIKPEQDKFIFSFSLRASPADPLVVIDQILLGATNSEGRYEKIFVPLAETKTLETPLRKANAFDLLAWRLQDHRGETYLATDPRSTPLIQTDPKNNIREFRLDFLFRSDSPIREIILNLKSADNVLDENGNIKFSRYYETHYRLSADQYDQQKVGPYYKVFVTLGGNHTPIMKGANDVTVITPDAKLQLVKMRAVNESLQILGTDDALIDSVLNSGLPKSCRTHF